MLDTAHLTADGLGTVRHGFFTRQGGASVGLYTGLNCGFGSQDERTAVAENRRRVVDAMGIGPLVTVHQHHSADVVTITAAPADTLKADAIVTASPGLLLGVLTADCAPILLADADARVIGAAHAGWRGAAGGIARATVDAMVALGAERHRIRAAIGPAISQPNYEVGPELLEAFEAHTPDAERFFVGGQGDRLLFDLPGALLHQLRQTGIGEASWIRRCTYAEPATFFSHRRGHHQGLPDYGRLISVIGL